MNVLVTGGSGSGKSAFAEQLAASLGNEGVYLATMVNRGAEAEARIKRHRQQRASLGFVTIECPDALPSPDTLAIENGAVVLLDDLGNLVANALFSPEGTMREPSAVLDRLTHEVQTFFARCVHVVVVTNEVGCEGPSPYEGTNTWVRLMGSLNCRLAAQADVAIEIIAGVPLVIKGSLPHVFQQGFHTHNTEQNRSERKTDVDEAVPRVPADADQAVPHATASASAGSPYTHPLNCETEAR